MRKLLVMLCAAALPIALAILTEPPVSATKMLGEAFIARYGSGLSVLYGCNICHSRESVEALNPYGMDFGNAFIPSGSCLEFFPPNTHTIPKGFCGYEHEEGFDSPYSSGCGRCHGVELRGLIAPSCFACHSRRWVEDPPAGISATGEGGIGVRPDAAFAMIEGMDSDGDGFSNIAEIKDLTNPGDPQSFPDATINVKVEMPRVWEREWINESDYLVVTLTPRGFREIDRRMYVSLKTTEGELVTTQLFWAEEVGGAVEAFFPSALLHVLFSDLTDQEATVVVSGFAEFGARFDSKVKVRLEGDAPHLLSKLKLRISPRMWDDHGKVTFTIKGKDVKRIDLSRPITVIGTSGKIVLVNVRRSKTKNVATAVLDASDARELIGFPLLDGVIHTIALTGFSADEHTTFNVTASVTTPSSDCYQFSAPRSHTVAKKVGGCAYLHAPGFDTPFANKCHYCHGADLRGTSITPSCFLCHPRLWNAAAPGSTR